MDSARTREEWKAMRLAKGLTQMQLASSAGLGSQGLVSQIENGLRPGKGTERRLLEVLAPATDGPVGGASS